MNQLDRAATYLQSRMIETSSDLVVYERPGVARFQINAVVGQMTDENTEQSNFVLRQGARDFVVDQDKLASGLPPDAPRPVRNDVIEHRGGKYIVNGDGFATTHYEATDAYGVAWRIHTRRDELSNAS